MSIDKTQILLKFGEDMCYQTLTAVFSTSNKKQCLKFGTYIQVGLIKIHVKFKNELYGFYRGEMTFLQIFINSIKIVT